MMGGILHKDDEFLYVLRKVPLEVFPCLKKDGKRIKLVNNTELMLLDFYIQLQISRCKSSAE